MNSITKVISVSRIWKHRVSLLAICFLLCACAASVPSQKPAAFSFTETTIDDIHAAIKNQSIDCEAITTGFLKRIKKYDEISNLNSIIYVNPDAIKKAKALDREYLATKAMGSLHCVPVILKDNFDTADITRSVPPMVKPGTPMTLAASPLVPAEVLLPRLRLTLALSVWALILGIRYEGPHPI